MEIAICLEFPARQVAEYLSKRNPDAYKRKEILMAAS